MKGGRRSKRNQGTIDDTDTRPVSTAAGSQSGPRSGNLETISPAIAAAARMEPTERSMPPVRMTKVMPAASTVLTALAAARCRDSGR